MLRDLPKGVLALSSVEMWERFSFYSMISLLVLYASATLQDGGLGLSDAAALRLTGLYGSLVYVSPILGGILADRILGRRNAVNLGAIIMCLGQITLAMPNKYSLYIGLTLLVLGSGLLKPTISSMIGEFYGEHDLRRESGFAIFYMAINIGGVLGPLLGGLVSEHYSYRMAFLLGAGGLIIALTNFAIANKNSLKEIGLKPTKYLISKNAPKIPLTVLEKRRIRIYLSMCVANILWNVVYALPYGLLTVYAAKNINRMIGTFHVPPTWYFSLYGILIVVLCPLLANFYNRLATRHIQFSLSQKLACGYFLVAVGCIILLPLAHAIHLNAAFQGSPWYLIGFYIFFALSELFTVPVLLSAATRLAPKRYASAMVASLMLISWAFGAYLGGEFGALAIQYNPTYLFLAIVFATILFGFLHLFFNRKVEQLCHELPNK